MFIFEPDVPPAYECSVWTEDCPPGMKCMPWSPDGGGAWSGTRCSPIARDPARIGEPCTFEGGPTSGIDDCEWHSVCFGVDPQTSLGTCIGLCIGPSPNPTCADPGSACSPTAGKFAYCFPKCSPIEDDCPDGWGCYPMSSGLLCVPSLFEAEAGEGCQFVNACVPGLACMNPEVAGACDSNPGCCSAFCDVDAPRTPCLQGQVCVPWDDEPDPDYPSLGICALPPD